MKIISVQNLKKYFGTTKAVDDISFDVNKGKIVGFLGPNGAGKSTTIKCLIDFLRPTSGEITLFEKSSIGNSKQIKSKIGFLDAEESLYKDWTGSEHINLLKKMKSIQTKEDELIEMLELDIDKKVSSLSTGNKKKLGLVLAMMHNPPLLVLDEPTSGLDPILQNKIYRLLQQRAQQGTTVFLSSHNLQEVEKICDEVIIINKGKIVAHEDIKKIKSKKIYTVEVYFSQEIKKEELSIKNTTITRDLKEGYEFEVKGNIMDFIKEIEKFKISDIQISHSPLEKIFLEYYK